MRRALALAAALLATGANAGTIEIDPVLVQSLSEAPEGLIRAYPYIIHFRKEGKDLYYVAGGHEQRVNSPTLSLIRRAFARYKIRRVVIEGNRNADGEVSKARVAEIEKDAKGGVFEWGETDYAALLAARRGIGAIGGEPAKKDVLDGVLKGGFGARDMLALDFVNMIPAYRSQGRLEKTGLRDLFDETMDWERHELGDRFGEPFTYSDFLAWHREKMGSEFDARSSRPVKPDADGTFLQRVAAATDLVRNRFLAGVISRELNAHGSVLVVYGNGHHAVQRRALEAAMGKPVYEGTLK